MNTRNNTANKDLQEILKDGLLNKKPLLGKGGILTPLIKDALESILSIEMQHHLDESKEAGSKNRRNGLSKKTMRSSTGSFELETPRDRNSNFEPMLIKKRQTTLTDELDSRILSLFSYGTSYRDIAQHIGDMYGVDATNSMINQITDSLLPEIDEWRNRPLESVYAVVFFDAIFFKVREEGRVITKAFYTVLGVNTQGQKELLGLYISENEGANFWCTVFADLKERGVSDILIACVDGLKGLPKAINSIFPKTVVQLCIVHQIRNSLKYVTSKNQKEFMNDLKPVYRASSNDFAVKKLQLFVDKWKKKYPVAVRSWENNWDNLSTYFQYDEHVRRLIYTTNPVESLHRNFRKYTKNKASFTSQNALLKLLYCAYKRIEEKWTKPINNWALILSQLDIHFPDRLNL